MKNIDLDAILPPRKPTISLPHPETAALLLHQAGIAGDDMATALEAVSRCRSYTSWSVAKSAKFVATAAAIGHITGPNLLLIPRLAQVAAED